MGIYENFPESRPQKLEHYDVKQLLDTNILPAARHFWGEEYYDPDKRLGDDFVEAMQYSPDGSRIAVSIRIADNVLEDDDFPSEEDESQFIGIELDNLEQQYTRRLRRRFGVDYSVWARVSYDFPLTDGEPPMAYAYYVIKDGDGDDVSKPDKKLTKYLDGLNGGDRTSLERDDSLTTQDRIDIHNILLALNVPEEAISRTAGGPEGAGQ